MDNHMDIKNHWERVYETKAPNAVSWFQPYPKTSMEFVTQSHLPLEANIIDMGGGDSIFLDALLKKGTRTVGR